MIMSKLRFSLILATVDRTEELARFLFFLDKQTYRNFELIIVDQNEDTRLLPIVAPYADKFTVLHLRSERGLSRARNVGLNHVTGDIIAFPDDDCYYPVELLSRVALFFTTHSKYDGVTGMGVGERNADLQPRFDKKDGLINRYNVWSRAVSYTIFLRAGVINAVGDFNESLGVGAGTPWGCAEETDYLIRAVSLGKHLYYCHLIEVVHERIEHVEDSKIIVRNARYAPGIGYVLKRHNYPFWFVLWVVLRSFVGAVLALVAGNRYKYLLRLTGAKGVAAGWLGT